MDAAVLDREQVAETALSIFRAKIQPRYHWVEREVLESEAHLAITEAMLLFDGSRGKPLLSWCLDKIRFFIMEFVREQARHKDRPVPIYFSSFIEPEELFIAPLPHLGARISLRELKELIAKHSVSLKHARILFDHVLSGKSHREIALELGVSLNSVYCAMVRQRRKLKATHEFIAVVKGVQS